MNRWIAWILLFVSLAPGRALSGERIPTVSRTESALSVSAPSALLMEKETGTVLYEKNAHERLFPASVTKVMTMLLIMEDIDSGKLSLDDVVTASARAASFGGSCVYLEEGEQMTVREMLKCIAVVSANDCAVAMAEHLAGSEEVFVERMNRRAEELGLEDSHFTSCSGLFDDGEHYSSAYDIAVMSRELLKHPGIKDFTTIWLDSIRGGAFELNNTNKLVYWYPGCTGLKTGYTSSALYCLSASAERDGVEYIAVVLRCESIEKRNQDAKTLLNYAFAGFQLCPLRPAEELPALPVDMGERDQRAASRRGRGLCAGAEKRRRARLSHRAAGTGRGAAAGRGASGDADRDAGRGNDRRASDHGGGDGAAHRLRRAARQAARRHARYEMLTAGKRRSDRPSFFLFSTKIAAVFL